jgi:hypothetical protein
VREQDFLTAIEADLGNLTLFGAYADFLDDRGEYDLAFAYRWAMRRGKWPQRIVWEPTDKLMWWQWIYSDDPATAFPDRFFAVVPKVFMHTRMATDLGYFHSRHASLADAMTALAAGLLDIKTLPG